jgi:hypothetical protein
MQYGYNICENFVSYDFWGEGQTQVYTNKTEF